MANPTRGLVETEYEIQTLGDPEVNSVGLIDQEWPMTPTAAAATVIFRKTLSGIGSHTGGRQVHGN